MNATAGKLCPRCGQSKPLLDFYAHKWRRNGRDEVCRECRKADSRARKAARRAAGACVDCGQPSAGKRYCVACLARRRTLAKSELPGTPAPAERRCSRCGQIQPLSAFYARAWGPDSICKRCIIRRQAEKESARRAAGRCIRCGVGTPAPGLATCPQCLAKRRARKARADLTAPAGGAVVFGGMSG